MINRLLLTTFALSSLLCAETDDSFSSERFLGIEAGYGEVQATNIIGKSTQVKGVEFGFRIGAQNEEWRTTLSGHNFNKDGENYFRGMLQFDRFVWASLYKTDDIIFKPYLGVHLGWLMYEGANTAKEDSFVYGGQTGIAWNVMRSVDFDFGYRYSFSQIDNVDNIGGFVFGVNYIY
ncbi:MAG: hypothetical protein IE889_07990 [Campylobacterales bacterium]|nr:hypothetical protein [Campylobacterales bacterium]